MSRNLEPSKLLNTAGFSRYAPLQLDFESQILITSNTTFVVPPNAKAVKFTAVGGGQAGVGTTSGAGAGYFEKTFYAPFTGLTTSFQLTIGAANGGNTILRDSAGTTIATAFGATAIGAGATVGVGGTASGGDINSQGSPGGITPGVGGAAGGPLGNSVYDSTYAGRWIYFRESIVNDNVRNYLVNTLEASRGSRVTSVGFNSLGVITAQYGALISPSGPGATVSGLFANGTAGGAGGFGGNGGAGPYPSGNGGPGGYGGNGGPGTSPSGRGGDGGYGGSGGAGAGNPYGPNRNGGSGGSGGYGANGGQGGSGGGGSYSPFPGSSITAGPGGPGGPGGFGAGGGRGGAGGSGLAGPYAPNPTAAPARPGGPGGSGGSGGFGGGGGASGAGGLAGSPPSTAGSNGPVGNGGAGAVYIEWTTKEPSKLGV